MSFHTPLHGNRKPAKKSKTAKANARPTPKRKVPLPQVEPALTKNDIAAALAATKKSVVVFDLDGCVSDDAWRFDFMRQHSNADARWQHYHAALGQDVPLKHGAALLSRAIAAGMHPVFITSRPEAFRALTAQWLFVNFSVIEDKTCSILMREDADESPTVAVKQSLMALLITEGADVVAAYDDREDVVTMYGSVFGVNAYALDRDGVRDHLNLRSHVTRALAPEEHAPELHTAHLHESMEAAVAGTSAWLRCGDAGQDKASGSVRPTRQDYNDVADILRNMAGTFEVKNAQYGNNAIKVGDVLKVLFPNGLKLQTAADQRHWHLFTLLVVKLTRYVNCNMKHKDSIHDLAVYAAMLEAETDCHDIKLDR
jgi:hypothetical protein